MSTVVRRTEAGVTRCAWAVSEAARDQRGAVMVIGLFMAVFLVGAIWYVVGIGEAIAFRETLQDSADAVAYTGAIHHAHGMEMLVMINLLMATLLSTLVAMRLVQLSLMGAMAINCPLFFLVAPAAICMAANSANQAVDKMAQSVDKGLNATLPMLNQLATVVAKTQPLMAQSHALAAANQYPDVAVQFHAPSLPLQGLPVEDEPQRLCMEATTFASGSERQAFSGGASALEGPVSGATEAFLCMGRGKCQGARDCPGAPGSSLSPPQLNPNAVGNSCSRAYSQCCSTRGPRPAQCPLQCNAQARRDFVKNCRFEVARAARSLGITSAPPAPAQPSVNCEGPKQLVCESTAGDDHFQVRAFVVGERPPESGPSGVNVAAHDLDEVEDLEDSGGMAFAQAEYFFDANSWGPASMWQFNWRARLRRFRHPTQPGVLPAPSTSGSGTQPNRPPQASGPGLSGYRIPHLTPALRRPVSREYIRFSRCVEACPLVQETEIRLGLTCEQRCAKRVLEQPYETIH